MIVVVTGGRDYSDYARVCDVLDDLTAYIPHARQITKLAHGGARGADTLAGAWAASRGVEEVVFPAQWNTYGRNADPIRNREMLDGAMPDLVVAFPGGTGTAGCIAEARKRHITVLEIIK